MTRINAQVKVLIAERTPSIADLIARNLRIQGYAIAGIVNSTEKAIEFATITVPDIVLLDLPLPGDMDVFTVGWKILSEIRCPVVYMTTQLENCTNQTTELNPNGFLLKTFTANELKLAIDHTLEQHRLEQGRDRDLQPAKVETETDEQFLTLLALASAMSPMPRVLFEGDRLILYVGSLDEAAILWDFCQFCNFPCRCQIFAWRWEIGQYQLYSQ